MTEEVSTLSRWSRLKQQAQAEKENTSKQSNQSDLENKQTVEFDKSGLTTEQDVSSVQITSNENNTPHIQPIDEPLLTDEDMPNIQSLTSSSDVSVFFNRGVSVALRKAALKYVFQLPIYNIRDGLNDYDEDYTVFEPLGDTVTCDMKFHKERKEREAEERKALLAEQEEAERAEQEALEAEDVEDQDAEEMDSDATDSTTDESGDRSQDVVADQEPDLLQADGSAMKQSSPENTAEVGT